MRVTRRVAGYDMWHGPHPRTATGKACQYAIRLPGSNKVVYTETLPEALAVIMPHGYAALSSDERRQARRVKAAEVAQTVQATLDARTAAKDAGDKPHVAPVALVESSYAPFTDVPAPGGLTLWVRPEDEWMFAQTLTDLGVAHVTAALTAAAN